MAKQRTRSQKEHAHHDFILSWQPSPIYAHVKRQKNIGHTSQSLSSSSTKKADISAQEPGTSSTRRGLVRSLILISLILCLEVVIYFVWK